MRLAPQGKGNAVGTPGRFARIAARRPAERIGERRRESDSLLQVQRARRLMKIILRGSLGT